MSQSVDLLYQHAYDCHAADVFRFTLAWANDWIAAEDLTHETYLRLWGHRGDVDWDRPILAWLLVTARRLASNRFRGLRRRVKTIPARGSQTSRCGSDGWTFGPPWTRSAPQIGPLWS